jgi:hypothetical protein
MPITVAQVINDIFLLWGIEDPNASSTGSRDRAMNDLNRAAQTLWANAEQLDYFNQEPISVTLLANTDSIQLPDDLQEVLGPVRRSDKVPLQPLRTRHEWENYARLYYGQESLAAALPLAYYLERKFVASPGEGESTLQFRLFAVPQAASDAPLTVDVVKNAPVYAWTDYCNGTTIPIPHDYGATLLIPLARHSAMSYHLFLRPERAPLIEADYQQARQVLGLAAPEVAEVRKEVSAPVATGGRR